MTSAITAPQLVTLRTAGQWSKLFLAGTEMPRTIFNARVNQAFAAPSDTVKPYDMLAQVTYDLDGITPIGVYGDVLPGMTCFVGTTGTGTGLYDKGIVRTRKAATSSILYFGEESSIEIADNDILTVIDSMEIWPKHVRMVSGVPYMDYDLAYSDQHTVFDPVPIMSADAVVELDLTELVTNGTFITNTDNWTAGTGVLLSVVSNALHVDRNGAGVIDHAYQDETTVVGKKYKVVVNVVSYSHQYEVYVGGVLLFDYAQGTGTKTYYYTATATTTRIAFRATNNSAATLDVDDVSLQRVETVPFDATDSWVFDSTISTYAWTTTAGSLSSSSVANPTLTIIAYPTGGKIRVALTVTAANGKTATGYRYVHVYNSDNPPQSVFQLNDCGGSWDEGGYSFDVTMYANAELTTIRDRAPMILFAQDHYGTTIAGQTSLGQLPGRENIVAMGWIDGESIEWNADRSQVSFTVQGPQFWMGKMPGFPPGVEINRPGVAAAWTTIPDLTVDRALWHLLHWRSTAIAVMDFYPTDDTRLAGAFEIPTESLWQQMAEIAETSIFARPCCDQYNRLFVEIDSQLVPEADRSTIPVVMEITAADRKDGMSIRRPVVDEVAMLDLSGVSVNSSGKGTALFSLANGHIFKRYGEIEIADRLLLSSQTQANQLAGLLIGKRDNQYPEWNIELAQNNRMIGICPRQYVSITVAAGDTVRGIAYTGNLIPRDVSFNWNEDTGFMSMVLTCEAESFEQIAITGDPPDDESAGGGGGGTLPPPPPPPPPPVTGDPLSVLVATTTGSGTICGMYYTLDFNSASPEWFEMNEGLTDDQKANVTRILKCPSGLILITVASTGSAIVDYVFYATALGQAWTLLIDYTMVDQGSYDYPHITAVGVNPNKSEEIVVVGGGNSGFRVGTKKVYIGDRGGLTLAGADVIDANAAEGRVWFALGKWFLECQMYATGSTRSWARLTASGTVDIPLVNFTDPVSSNGFSRAAGGLIFFFDASAGNIHVIPNCYSSISDTIYSGLTLGDAIAVSPSGTILVENQGSGLRPWKSTNGGASWAELTAAPLGITFYDVENCDNETGFIIVGSTCSVYYTADGGDNWSNKIGNLTSISALMSVKKAKFIA